MWQPCIIYGQASGVPGPPPPHGYGLVGVGGGWRVRRVVFGGVLLGAAMGHREGRDLTQALRKPQTR